jgi:hypothetical protein
MKIWGRWATVGFALLAIVLGVVTAGVAEDIVVPASQNFDRSSDGATEAVLALVVATRTLSLMALAFFAGLDLGIDKTARGAFYLPWGVMQKQMHD